MLTRTYLKKPNILSSYIIIKKIIVNITIKKTQILFENYNIIR